jgi:Holliday junction resolvase RusA-like endonuclease
MSISFVVNEKPPYKQAPADVVEGRNQAQRKETCQQEARKVFAGHNVLTNPCTVSIRYWRGQGRADSANIIGGILDALENIVYQDDNQVVEISYIEHRAMHSDRYQITITEVV